jgi:threonine aldolase
MSATPGYYSVVQYCPDASRLEAINIGVLLFSPAHAFLRVRFGNAKTAIHELFGDQDWDFIEKQERALESRLAREITTLDDLDVVVSTQANAVTLTTPRSTKLLKDPAMELDGLFDRLVQHRRNVVTAKDSAS